MTGWYDSTEFLTVAYQDDFLGGIWHTPETLARNGSYYGVTGFPTVVFQGTERFEGVDPATTGSGEPYRDAYLNLKGPSPFTLETTRFDLAAGIAEFELGIVSDPGDVSNLYLRAVLYEDHLFDGPDEHNHVTRDILYAPVPADDLVTISAVGETQTFSKPFGLDPSWDPANLNIVAWIQDEDDKAIRQATSSVPPPTYALNYYSGERAEYTDVGVPLSMDEFAVFNVGGASDIFNARIVEERSPADWTVMLSDGATTSPDTLSVSLDPGEGQAFHLEVNPASPGYAVYRVELFQNGDPTKIKPIVYTVVTGNLPILVMDDDGSMAFEDYYTAALDAAGFTDYGVWPRNQRAFPVALGTYCAVVWNLGWNFPHLTTEDMSALGTFLDEGGQLFISGQDLGWEMEESLGGAAATWYRSYLQVNYRGDDIDPDDVLLLSVDGVAGDPVGSDGAGVPLTYRIENVVGGDDGADNQVYPSAIAVLPSTDPSWNPAADTQLIYRYMDGQGAALRVETPDYRLVYFAFGFEAIDNPTNRTAVMDRIINWLDIDCLGGACGLGIPGSITTLALAKSGGDIVFSWMADGRAESGYNIYSTDDETIIPILRGDGGCGVDCIPILSEPSTTATLSSGITDGLAFYQVLGVCGMGVEGPN